MKVHSFSHIGLNIDFHHPQGARLKLQPATEDLYGVEKEHAAIFIETRSGQMLSTADLLELYLSRVGKTADDYLPDGATAGDRQIITFPIQIPQNSFHMMTDHGAVSIKALKIVIDVTVA